MGTVRIRGRSGPKNAVAECLTRCGALVTENTAAGPADDYDRNVAAGRQHAVTHPAHVVLVDVSYTIRYENHPAGQTT